MSSRVAIGENPGEALRAQRRKRGLTLASLSERTAIPISTLSKLENGRMTLSYSQLLRISKGLEIDIAEILGGTSKSEAPPPLTRRSITRDGEGPTVATPTYNYQYPASDLLNKKLNAMTIEVTATSIEQFSELPRHAGEEFAVVMEGEVDFHCEHYAPVRLKRGDSVYFDGTMAHAYVAVDGPSKILSICTGGDE